ncbi:MAG: fluoride efflux transporter CrcB [Burkholderiaceae bacterium]
MSLVSLAAVFCGAGAGACLRWFLGLWLNPLWPTVPLGTVAANLGGGLLVGLAVQFFAQHPQLAPEWRLLAITGFLGGLTTFSTFSAEVVDLLARHQPGWALGAAGLHLGGSLALTALGLWLARAGSLAGA